MSNIIRRIIMINDREMIRSQEVHSRENKTRTYETPRV